MFDFIVVAINNHDTFSSFKVVISELCDFEMRLNATHAIFSSIAFYTIHGKTNTKSRGFQGNSFHIGAINKKNSQS